jgi:surface polysaccharide O-acyltransferase-like enzyme
MGLGMAPSSAALNNLRACAIVSLLAFHSVLAYLDFLPTTPFAFDRAPYRWVAFPMVDAQRFLGFDIFCGFEDVYLMSLMFFLSGVFVWPSILRKGEAAFLQGRFLRLCIPAALAVLLLMPLAHYPTYRVGAIDPGIAAYLSHWLALPFWPGGPPWFLWQLFVFNLAAATLCALKPLWCRRLARMSATGGTDPRRYFWGLVALSALAYVPLALAFGPLRWFEYGIFTFQVSRPLHYAVYFFAGFGIGVYGLERGLLAADGVLAQRWAAWLTTACLAFVLWMGLTALSLQPDAIAATRIASHLAFALSCASSCFALFALFLRFAARRTPLFDTAAENAYGLYLVHYVFVVWLQYALLDAAIPAPAKGPIVFAGVLALSWATTSALRRAPLAWRLIGTERVLAKAP